MARPGPRTVALGLLAACTSGSEVPSDRGPEAAPTAPVHPLSEAADAPWMQSVWWRGLPEERVLGVTFAVGRGERAPVVSVVAGDAPRVTWRIPGPGQAERLTDNVQPASRDATSATEAGKRVTLEREERVTRVRVHGTAGEPGQELVRDPSAPELVAPSIDAAGRAVFVERRDGAGGIYRVDLATGLPTRVVAGPSVGAPRAWDRGDGERVVYVEEQPGHAPLLIVAQPAPPDLVPAAAWLGASPPGDLLAATPTSAGWVLFEGCDGVPSVEVAAQGEAVIVNGVRASLAWPDGCGDGCAVLLEPTPSGAPREVVQVSRRPDGAWTLAFSPQTGAVASGTWLPAAEAEGAARVAACAPPIPEGAWLQVPRAFGGPQERFDGLEVRQDRLLVHGARRGKQPIVVHVPHDDRSIRTQSALRPTPLERGRVVREADGVEVIAADGGLTWRAGGQDSELLPPSPSRRIESLALSDDLGVLVFDDDGADAGIWRVDVRAGEMVRVAHSGRAPVVYTRRGQEWIAFLDRRDGRDVVVSAVAMSDEDRARWSDGPRRLDALEPAWAAIQREESGWVRCGGGFDVSLSLLADGGPVVSFGSDAHPVHAILTDGEDTHLVRSGEAGIPTVVATVRGHREAVDAPGAAVQWVDRRAEPWVTIAAWIPAHEAGQLTVGGTCRKR